MARVLVTLDGVLSDMVTAMAVRLIRAHGIALDDAWHMALFDHSAAADLAASWEFWKYVPPRVDAMRAFPLLAGRADVHVASHYPAGQVLIRRWLDRYGLAYTAVHETYPAGSFACVIDHHPRVLSSQSSPVIVMNYPYNQHVQAPYRCTSVLEAVQCCFDIARL